MVLFFVLGGFIMVRTHCDAFGQPGRLGLICERMAGWLLGARGREAAVSSGRHQPASPS